MFEAIRNKLRVVRIGVCRGIGDFSEARALGRDFVGDLVCGTLAGIEICIHTTILISD